MAQFKFNKLIVKEPDNSNTFHSRKNLKDVQILSIEVNNVFQQRESLKQMKKDHSLRRGRILLLVSLQACRVDRSYLKRVGKKHGKTNISSGCIWCHMM